MLQLRPNEAIDAADLREGARKRTIILDCCRKVHAPRISEMVEMVKAAYERAARDPQACRFYYDRWIEQCDPMLIVAHSCSHNEYSYDDENYGGYYSYSLLKGAADWAKTLSIDTSKHYKVLDIVEAHNHAVPKVQSLSGGLQNPTISKPKSAEKFLPFAIVA